MPTLATVAAFGFPDLDCNRLLPLYRQLGCRTVQFYRNTNNPPNLHEALKITEDAGMKVDSIHGVFGPKFDPTNPDESIRHNAVKTYYEEGQLAVELGGPMVVVHPAPGIGPGGQNDEDLAIRQLQMQKTFEQLAEYGEKLGVTYLVENLPADYSFGTDPVLLASLIRKFDHPNIRMCFDVSHANITSDVCNTLEQCRDVVAYLHITDNDGVKDLHQIPGQGSCPFDRLQPVFEKMDDDLPAMLELFEKPCAIERMVADGMGEQMKRWFSLNS